MRLTLPPVYALNDWRAKNPVRQLAAPGSSAEGSLATFSRGRLVGHVFQTTERGESVLIVPRTKSLPDSHDRIVAGTLNPTAATEDLSRAPWLRHPLHKVAADHESEIGAVLQSWQGGFSFAHEDVGGGRVGLRPPQIGAVHAVLAHWTVSTDVATIVMPTGTGKTDTMLAILVSAACKKVLVVAPTDALRSQLADKFVTLGILKAPNSGVLASTVMFPIVCTLLHVPRDAAEVDKIFGSAQVLVTTSAVAAQCNTGVQERMAFHCSHLFIDEAHHAEAPTWAVFKSHFTGRRVLQFTATPFRDDDRPLDGQIIFKYPLRKAQEEGYFKPIRFRQIVEFDQGIADKKIAEAAIEQLRTDTERKHVLMARVDSVARAEEVFLLYEKYTEFNPVQLHTGVKSKQQRDTRRQSIISGASRIVVCVDMLGEGFDLPELKIAAFHDIRKSLAVTLQLAGRFTRARPDLGDATFVANTANVYVQDELRKLYAQDPDWNVLLPDLSEKLIGEQVSLQEFLAGFTEFAPEVPLKSVHPATSAVVYKTTCDAWRPEKFRSALPAIESCEQVYHAVNLTKKTLVVVTARRMGVSWTDVESIFTLEWNLYVVIWFREQQLLFINSSANAGEYKTLARAIAGEDATLISGETVFRAFAKIARLQLQNVGLTEQLGRNVRYTGRMGSDVESGLPDIQRRNARKSVLSGVGFEGGKKVSVGASRKGRIWSHRRERIDGLVAWCRDVGAKLLDDGIDPEDVLKGTLEERLVADRPHKVPIAVDWPERMYLAPEDRWTLRIDGREFCVDEVALEAEAYAADGPLRIVVRTESTRILLTLELFETNKNPDFKFVSEGTVSIRKGSAAEVDLVDYFNEDPPLIWFADGSSLEGNNYVELREGRPPYDSSKIEAWDWRDVNIRKESQGDEKAADSIQGRVIRELKRREYDVIVDDDRSGEAADIVAIRLMKVGDSPAIIEVEFYHCKFSSASAPGARIGDLYEVCGQAQKSVRWTSSGVKRADLFTHLLRRAGREIERRDRYELGDSHKLQTIRDMSHACEMKMRIFVVQPGLSKAAVSLSQLELLSVTETYLFETYQLAFGVIASP